MQTLINYNISRYIDKITIKINMQYSKNLLIIALEIYFVTSIVLPWY